jgi:hypothetical protein
MIQRFAAQLTEQERDVLKYRLSRAIIAGLARSVQGAPPLMLLQALRDIQPYRSSVPPSGVSYVGRAEFITEEMLASLRAECIHWRSHARLNGYQMISGVDTPRSRSVAEQVASSRAVVDWVSRRAGRCQPSFVTNYLYYDAEGHYCEPHVDNAFTPVTAMLCLRHDGPIHSESRVIGPDGTSTVYRLRPGEIALFYGTCVIHSRSPVLQGEIVHCLLMSFRPHDES